MNKWDQRFLGLAQHVSSWSKDPSTKVGAVIADSYNRVLSLGFNGFPVGVNDAPGRLNDRQTKYQMVVHAELNAVLFAQSSQLQLADATLYTYPFPPCTNCAGAIIQSGIKRIVSYSDVPERWSEDFELAFAMFEESGVQITVTNEGLQ